MRISDYKGEKALYKLAEMLEPITVIMTDDEVKDNLRKKSGRMAAVKAMISKHAHAVIEIFGILDDVDMTKDYDKYAETVTLISLPKRLLEILNDPDLMELFYSEGQNDSSASSGSRTVSTEE